FGQERKVGHVRVGVDHGDGGFAPTEVLQQILGGGQAEVATTDDEDSWTQFRVSDECHMTMLDLCENFHELFLHSSRTPQIRAVPGPGVSVGGGGRGSARAP